MILADTSVVIDYIRGKDAKLQTVVPTLAVAICGFVRAEILFGSRDAAHRAKLVTQLKMFHQLPFPETLWDASAIIWQRFAGMV